MNDVAARLGSRGEVVLVEAHGHPSFRQLLLKHRDKESLPGPSVRSNYLLVVHPVIQIGQPATTEDIHGGRQIEGGLHAARG